MHAASFLRRREIVLDASLLHRSGELSRILAHELSHFVWLRAGNSLRNSWGRLLAAELERGVRGELGWSAEQRKGRLTARDARDGTLRWREYACESFCDSAAWLFSGLRRHSEFTLAKRYCRARRAWLRSAFSKPEISI